MCQGRTHVLSGMATWLAATGTAAALGVPVDAGTIAVGAGVAGGAALLPDSDHPNAAIAHALGPVSRFICRRVAKLVGGHRKATHYAAAVPVFAGIAWLASELASWGLFAVVALLTAWGLRLLSEELDNALLGAGEIAAGCAVAWWATAYVDMGWWVFAAVAVGCLAHDLGDLTTKGPIRFLWPLPWRISLGLYRTGHWFERAVVAPVLAVAVVWLGWRQVALPAWEQVVRPVLAAWVP